MMRKHRGMGNLKSGWEYLAPQDPGLPKRRFRKITETLGTFGVGRVFNTKDKKLILHVYFLF